LDRAREWVSIPPLSRRNDAHVYCWNI
jgi:hypothetical protein